MRKLLNTLFVLTEDSYLSLDGENVVVSRERGEIARFPLHTLEGILTLPTPALPLRSWAPAPNAAST